VNSREKGNFWCRRKSDGHQVEKVTFVSMKQERKKKRRVYLGVREERRGSQKKEKKSRHRSRALEGGGRLVSCRKKKEFKTLSGQKIR